MSVGKNMADGRVGEKNHLNVLTINSQRPNFEIPETIRKLSGQHALKMRRNPSGYKIIFIFFFLISMDILSIDLFGVDVK